MKSSFTLVMSIAFAMVCAGQEINPRMVLAKQHAIAPSVKQVYAVRCSECGAAFKAKPKTCACVGAFTMEQGRVRREYALGFRCAKCKERFTANFSFIVEPARAEPVIELAAKAPSRIQSPKTRP